MNRRTFLRSTAAIGAGVLAFRRRAWAFAQSPTNIRKFVTSLPGLGPLAANEIGQYLPLATKNTISFAGQLTDSYSIAAAPFHQRMHPDLPGKTEFIGYFDLATFDQKYLGGAIIATKNRPVLLNVTNKAPNRAIVPVDPGLMAGPNLMVGDLPLNRIVPHLHGGATPWFSDGTPFQWYTPTGFAGPSFLNVPGTNPPAGSAAFYYPNQQSTRLVWYHDHAVGITRTNVYLGLAAPYMIVDDFETGLVNTGLLPDLIGIPLVMQDKSFVPGDILTQDPTWRWGKPGDLWYPHIYEPNVFADGTPNPKGRWDWGPTDDPPAQGTMPLPAPACEIPEAFFDTIVINGGIYPKLNVPPKRVRFRILNASQARFFHLNLYRESPYSPGEANLSAFGPIMYQFGNEGGFLPTVAVHKNNVPLTPDREYCEDSDGPFNLLLAQRQRFRGDPSNYKLVGHPIAPEPNDRLEGDSTLQSRRNHDHSHEVHATHAPRRHGRSN